MRALDTLQRLAKQAVDRERQALAVIAAEIVEVEADIRSRQHAIARETGAPLDFMTSGVTLVAFLHAQREQLGKLEERLGSLQQEYAVQLQRLRDERVDEKRYERLAERLARKTALEAAAREQKLADELAVLYRQKDS